MAAVERFMVALEDILSELEHMVCAVSLWVTHWLLLYRPVAGQGPVV